MVFGVNLDVGIQGFPVNDGALCEELIVVGIGLPYFHAPQVADLRTANVLLQFRRRMHIDQLN